MWTLYHRQGLLAIPTPATNLSMDWLIEVSPEKYAIFIDLFSVFKILFAFLREVIIVPKHFPTELVILVFSEASKKML